MPSVALNGVDLWVERHGHAGGTAVVLLHGLGSSSADWSFQIPALSARYRVLPVDLRGHGRSRPARGSLGVERLARDVFEALAALGEDPVHVVGLSLGGCVGLAMAMMHPAGVRSLTLVNAFAKLSPAGVGGLVRAGRRVGLACVAPMPALAAHVAGTLFPDPEQRGLYDAAVQSLSATPRRTYLAAMGALARFDARRRLPEVRCPTLVVVGDRDQTVPRAAADALCQGIPHVRLVVVCNSGHATPYDQADVFNRELLDFLAGL